METRISVVAFVTGTIIRTQILRNDFVQRYSPAAVAVYAYVYALLKRCPTNPYRMGLTALSSNDAWAPYVVNEKASDRRVWGFFVFWIRQLLSMPETPTLSCVFLNVFNMAINAKPRTYRYDRLLRK
jgi:hypothetical protein